MNTQNITALHKLSNLSYSQWNKGYKPVPAKKSCKKYLRKYKYFLFVLSSLNGYFLLYKGKLLCDEKNMLKNIDYRLVLYNHNFYYLNLN